MSKLLPQLLRLALLACVPLLAWPVASRAGSSEPDFVISSGRAGGNYDGVARRLATVLTSGHDFYVEVETSGGSVENLSRLGDPENPVGVTLTQADALSGYLEEHPDFANDLVVLSRVGRECVILIARRGGGIASVADLKTPAGRSRPGSRLS